MLLHQAISIALEAMTTAYVVTPGSNITYTAMRHFNDTGITHYNLLLPTLISFFGMLLGVAFNWCTGWCISKLRSPTHYPRPQQFMHGAGLWLLALSAVPILGGIIMVIAGYFHVPWLRVLAVSGLSMVLMLLWQMS